MIQRWRMTTIIIGDSACRCIQAIGHRGALLVFVDTDARPALMVQYGSALPAVCLRVIELVKDPAGRCEPISVPVYQRTCRLDMLPHLCAIAWWHVQRYIQGSGGLSWDACRHQVEMRRRRRGYGQP